MPVCLWLFARVCVFFFLGGLASVCASFSLNLWQTSDCVHLPSSACMRFARKSLMFLERRWRTTTCTRSSRSGSCGGRIFSSLPQLSAQICRLCFCHRPTAPSSMMSSCLSFRLCCACVVVVLGVVICVCLLFMCVCVLPSSICPLALHFHVH